MNLRRIPALVVTICFQLLEMYAYAPIITNFSPKDYGAETQNWAVTQDRDGRIYVGNNCCLLCFNGKSWKQYYPFGEDNKAIIRSLYADEMSDRVYVGAFKEFGYATFDRKGDLVYTSLSSALKDTDFGNDEIWYITRIKNKIFFIYFTTYYIYDVDTGEVERHFDNTSYFWHLGERLYLSPKSNVIRRYDGTDSSFETLDDDMPYVISMFSMPDGSTAAVSEDRGLYRIVSGRAVRTDSLGDDWGIANRTIKCSDGTIVVGFLSKGIRAFDGNGRELWHLNTENGLMDNTVLALFEDDCNNVWAALDKGIAVIFKGDDNILPVSECYQGKITSALLEGHDLYVGTNQGLTKFCLSEDFRTVLSVKPFNIRRQVWSLYERDGLIFVGGNGECCIVGKDDALVPLSDAAGGIEPRVLNLYGKEDMLIQGSFAALYIYERGENGAWKFRNTVDGFLKPVSALEIDYLGNVWMEHRYEGLCRITLSDDCMTKVSETSYPDFRLKVCKMGGACFVLRDRRVLLL